MERELEVILAQDKEGRRRKCFFVCLVEAVTYSYCTVHVKLDAVAFVCNSIYNGASLLKCIIVECNLSRLHMLK